jgi:hypothetical protein
LLDTFGSLQEDVVVVVDARPAVVLVDATSDASVSRHLSASVDPSTTGQSSISLSTHSLNAASPTAVGSRARILMNIHSLTSFSLAPTL